MKILPELPEDPRQDRGTVVGNASRSLCDTWVKAVSKKELMFHTSACWILETDTRKPKYRNRQTFVSLYIYKVQCFHLFHYFETPNACNHPAP